MRNRSLVASFLFLLPLTACVPSESRPVETRTAKVQLTGNEHTVTYTHERSSRGGHTVSVTSRPPVDEVRIEFLGSTGELLSSHQGLDEIVATNELEPRNVKIMVTANGARATVATIDL